ncbi:MAG: glyoxylase-like metal-dependent hydrolase (beta-lactamase superfamily II) [Candidatus Azotimanducaceae bacterium]|jgi:sulfur dioxygenase
MFSAILFKQLFDEDSGTFSYLLADPESRQAVIIDSVYEKYTRDLALIQELDLHLLACLETHCHADHVTAAWLFKNSLGSQIVASAHSGIDVLDHSIAEGDTIQFGRFHLRVIATPGHTDGCVSYLLDDLSMVFTGDSLLIRGCGRTDFQQGSASHLYHSITEGLFSLPDDCLVYPAHDYAGRTASSIGEEKLFNPRIGGQANENDFVGYMENMHLPHPKKLEIAVPANVKGGRPDESQLPKAPAWAPVVTTYSGVLEISPQWVAAHKSQVHILDVRTTVETDEENAKVAGAQLIPIDELRDRLTEVPTDKPVMTICRSGKRSVLAFSILKDRGWKEVANIQGGLLRWQKEGLPLDFG